MDLLHGGGSMAPTRVGGGQTVFFIFAE